MILRHVFPCGCLGSPVDREASPSCLRCSQTSDSDESVEPTPLSRTQGKLLTVSHLVGPISSNDSEESVTRRLDTIAEQGESQCTPLADTPLKSKFSGSYSMPSLEKREPWNPYEPHAAVRSHARRPRTARMAALCDSGEQVIYQCHPSNAPKVQLHRSRKPNQASGAKQPVQALTSPFPSPSITSSPDPTSPTSPSLSMKPTHLPLTATPKSASSIGTGMCEIASPEGADPQAAAADTSFAKDSASASSIPRIPTFPAAFTTTSKALQKHETPASEPHLPKRGHHLEDFWPQGMSYEALKLLHERLNQEDQYFLSPPLTEKSFGPPAKIPSQRGRSPEPRPQGHHACAASAADMPRGFQWIDCDKSPSEADNSLPARSPSNTGREVQATLGPAFKESHSPVCSSKERILSPCSQPISHPDAPVQHSVQPDCGSFMEASMVTGGPITGSQYSQPSSHLPPPGSMISVASVEVLRPESFSRLPSPPYTQRSASLKGSQLDISSGAPSPVCTSSASSCQVHDKRSETVAPLLNSGTPSSGNHGVPFIAQVVQHPSSSTPALMQAGGKGSNGSAQSACCAQSVLASGAGTVALERTVDCVRAIGGEPLQGSGGAAPVVVPAKIEELLHGACPKSPRSFTATCGVQNKAAEGARPASGSPAAPVPRIAEPLLHAEATTKIHAHRESDGTVCSSPDIPAACSGGQARGATSSSESTAAHVAPLPPPPPRPSPPRRSTTTCIPNRPASTTVSGLSKKSVSSLSNVRHLLPSESTRSSKEGVLSPLDPRQTVSLPLSLATAASASGCPSSASSLFSDSNVPEPAAQPPHRMSPSRPVMIATPPSPFATKSGATLPLSSSTDTVAPSSVQWAHTQHSDRAQYLGSKQCPAFKRNTNVAAGNSGHLTRGFSGIPSASLGRRAPAQDAGHRSEPISSACSGTKLPTLGSCQRLQRRSSVVVSAHCEEIRSLCPSSLAFSAPVEVRLEERQRTAPDVLRCSITRGGLPSRVAAPEQRSESCGVGLTDPSKTHVSSDLQAAAQAKPVEPCVAQTGSVTVGNPPRLHLTRSTDSEASFAVAEVHPATCSQASRGDGGERALLEKGPQSHPTGHQKAPSVSRLPNFQKPKGAAGGCAFARAASLLAACETAPVEEVATTAYPSSSDANTRCTSPSPSSHGADGIAGSPAVSNAFDVPLRQPDNTQGCAPSMAARIQRFSVLGSGNPIISNSNPINSNSLPADNNDTCARMLRDVEKPFGASSCADSGYTSQRSEGSAARMAKALDRMETAMLLPSEHGVHSQGQEDEWGSQSSNQSLSAGARPTQIVDLHPFISACRLQHVAGTVQSMPSAVQPPPPGMPASKAPSAGGNAQGPSIAANPAIPRCQPSTASASAPALDSAPSPHIAAPQHSRVARSAGMPAGLLPSGCGGVQHPMQADKARAATTKYLPMPLVPHHSLDRDTSEAFNAQQAFAGREGVGPNADVGLGRAEPSSFQKPKTGKQHAQQQVAGCAAGQPLIPSEARHSPCDSAKTSDEEPAQSSAARASRRPLLQGSSRRDALSTAVPALWTADLKSTDLSLAAHSRLQPTNGTRQSAPLSSNMASSYRTASSHLLDASSHVTTSCKSASSAQSPDITSNVTSSHQSTSSPFVEASSGSASGTSARGTSMTLPGSYRTDAGASTAAVMPFSWEKPDTGLALFETSANCTPSRNMHQQACIADGHPTGDEVPPSVSAGRVTVSIASSSTEDDEESGLLVAVDAQSQLAVHEASETLTSSPRDVPRALELFKVHPSSYQMEAELPNVGATAGDNIAAASSSPTHRTGVAAGTSQKVEGTHDGADKGQQNGRGVMARWSWRLLRRVLGSPIVGPDGRLSDRHVAAEAPAVLGPCGAGQGSRGARGDQGCGGDLRLFKRGCRG